jgi:hypothetical protein
MPRRSWSARPTHLGDAPVVEWTLAKVMLMPAHPTQLILVKQYSRSRLLTLRTNAMSWLSSYNTRIGRQPANAKDLHRPLTAADNLEETRPGER